MRSASAKAMRKTAEAYSHSAVDMLAPGIRAALDNELKTRGRVDALETAMESMDKRTLIGRLKWLLLGK